MLQTRLGSPDRAGARLRVIDDMRYSHMAVLLAVSAITWTPRIDKMGDSQALCVVTPITYLPYAVLSYARENAKFRMRDSKRYNGYIGPR